MNLLKLKHNLTFNVSPSQNSHKFTHFHSSSKNFKYPFKPFTSLSSSTLVPFIPTFKVSSFSRTEPSFSLNYDENDSKVYDFEENLAQNSIVYQKTLRLVECSMFAAVTGLVYFLSNSLSIENYFGCFFSLPIVITSMRWGVAAGRKTMVATAMLLFVLSGPLKALIYTLTHGVVGFTMGTLWSLRADWCTSVLVCTLARATGAVGYVLVTSFLIRENILALITINIHASLTLIFSAIGVNSIPSMNFIYTLFGILVLLNSASFVFLLHLLYSVFLTRLGMKESLRLPKWLEKAL